MGISVDAPVHSKKLHRKMELGFPLLSDVEMKATRAYGVVQKDRNISVPSVFIVDKSGRIIFRHVTDNFTVRPSVETILTKVPR